MEKHHNPIKIQSCENALEQLIICLHICDVTIHKNMASKGASITSAHNGQINELLISQCHKPTYVRVNTALNATIGTLAV